MSYHEHGLIVRFGSFYARFTNQVQWCAAQRRMKIEQEKIEMQQREDAQRQAVRQAAFLKLMRHRRENTASSRRRKSRLVHQYRSASNAHIAVKVWVLAGGTFTQAKLEPINNKQ